MSLTNGNNMKCLIIHGFGGSVNDVKPLAEHLTGLGYYVACPVLKGHSADKSGMKSATCNEWIDSAEQELIKLKETEGEILLIGFSMGGLIAFDLACKYNVKVIVTINTPIFYWNMNQVFHNLLDDVRNRKPNHIRKYLQAKNRSPIFALRQFLLLLNNTKPKLKDIKCPILVIQAEDDDAVRIKSVDYIKNNVSSERKIIRYFHEGGHMILLSPIAGQVMSCVDDFLQGNN